VSRLFYEDRIEPVTPVELAAAHADGGHDALDGGHGGDVAGAVEASGPTAPLPIGGGSHLVDPAETPDERNP